MYTDADRTDPVRTAWYVEGWRTWGLAAVIIILRRPARARALTFSPFPLDPYTVLYIIIIIRRTERDSSRSLRIIQLELDGSSLSALQGETVFRRFIESLHPVRASLHRVPTTLFTIPPSLSPYLNTSLVIRSLSGRVQRFRDYTASYIYIRIVPVPSSAAAAAREVGKKSFCLIAGRLFRD